MLFRRSGFGKNIFLQKIRGKIVSRVQELWNTSCVKSVNTCFQKLNLCGYSSMCIMATQDDSAKNIVDLLETMVQDKVAQKMQLWANKLKYILNHGTALMLKKFGRAKSYNADCLFVSFDKSLNNLTPASDLDICI